MTTISLKNAFSYKPTKKGGLEMKNIYYEKTIYEDHNVKHLTLKDFIEACDMLNLPVFEVETTNNPFAEPHREVKARMYNSMSEYRKTMPYWSARAYDYENDGPTYYLEYPDIAEGIFEVSATNNSSSYRWHFEVAGECVVIHSVHTYTD